MSEPTPSPLPWTTCYDISVDAFQLTAADDIRRGHTLCGNDAAFVVNAVNSHQALVDALRVATRQMEIFRSYYESEFRISSDPPDVEYEQACQQIRDALQLAGVSDPSESQ